MMRRDSEVHDGASLRHLLHCRDYRVLVSAVSKDPNPKITVLLIPAEARATALVVKVPLSDVAEAAVHRERQLLTALGAVDDKELSATVPCVVGTVGLERRTALVMTAVGGVPMATAYNRWRHTASRRKVTRDFCIAEGWLRLLWANTQCGHGPVELDRGTCTDLAARFSRERLLSQVLQSLEGAYEALRGWSGPLTAVHGDFWFGNLLTTGERICGVVDWEAGAACGQPLRDLSRFALSYALYLDRHTRPGRAVHGHRGLSADRWGNGIRHAIGGEDWFGGVFRGFLRRGLACLGLPERLWWMVAICGIADVAASADHPGFALSHFQLLADLTAGKTIEGESG